MVEIKEKDGYIHTYTDYSNSFVKKAKELHGKWTGESWKFKLEDKEYVKKALFEVYGENGYDSIKRVRVRVDLYEVERQDKEWGQEASLFGKTLVRRPGRDRAVKPSDDVYIVEGSFPHKGGSTNNPRLDTPEGLILEVKNVPLTKAEEEIAIYGDCISIIAEEEEVAIDTVTAEPVSKEDLISNVIKTIEELQKLEQNEKYNIQLGKIIKYLNNTYNTK